MTDKRHTGLHFAVLFLLGFITLVVQTLLFRVFLTVYEGSELGVGIFFCSWLVWVAAGACIARITGTRHAGGPATFDLLLFLYLPAFVVQQAVILHSRELAGVASYELFPFMRMLGLSILANAPVSFLTGFLFTTGCEWISRARTTPVAHVYMAEALGSFTGGMLVTLLLVCRLTPERIFILVALVLSLVLFAFRWKVKEQKAFILPALLALLCVGSSIPERWTARRHAQTWQRLLPRETYRGHFTTAQADYLYGEAHEQFDVMAWESIIESIPNAPYGNEVAALTLAQHPSASTILVVGAGAYPVCAAFLTLPQVSNVTWLAPDPHYPEQLLEHLPSRLRIDNARLQVPPVEIERFLETHHTPFDMIILRLPNVTTLALNRFFTVDFYERMRGHLTPEGMVCVRATGGENYMGRELTDMGASVLTTLREVFPHIAIKPGTESWFIASPADRVSQDAPRLVEQYARLPGSENLYPSAGLYSLYPEDRAAFQMNAYQAVIEEDTDQRLLNTDKIPRALLHALLFAGRHEDANISFAPIIAWLQESGRFIILCGLLLFFLLRVVYLRREMQYPNPGVLSAADSRLLIMTTGFTGMALSILLMYLYQAAFGVIFLTVGLISSLFMIGIFAGSSVCNRLLDTEARRPSRLLALVLGLHILLCLGLAIRHHLSAPGFMVMFFVSGCINGMYIPIGAACLERNRVSVRMAGSFIEAADNLGGAAGGLLCGIVLLPIFGATMTLAFLAALLFTNFAPLLARKSARPSVPGAARTTHPIIFAGYLFSGIAVLLLLSNQVHTREQEAEQESAIAQSDTNGYFFSTARFAPEMRGYNGPIVLALRTDANGVLLDFTVLQANETAEYLQHTLQWAERLKGKNIFQDDAFSGIDALSGATYTSEALKNGIQTAGHAFAKALREDASSSVPRAAATTKHPLLPSLLFSGLVLLALIIHYRGMFSARIIFLVITLATSGFIYNMQYSLDQIFLLLEFHVPLIGFTVPFLLVVIVPLLVVLFGNLYCGYLCPFGALQELIANLQPRRWQSKTALSDRTWFYLRKVKYLIFFTAVFFVTLLGRKDFVLGDPLISAFSEHRRQGMILLLAALLFLSFFYRRFWCRILCPTGAFLSLLNSIKLLRRFQQKVPWRLCDCGVTAPNDLDCICCNRCLRHARANKKTLSRSTPFGAADIAAVLVTIGIICWWPSLIIQTPITDTFPSSTEETPPPAGRSSPAPSRRRPSAQDPANLRGRPRAVDMNALNSKIRNNQLSDHEALYYQKEAGK